MKNALPKKPLPRDDYDVVAVSNASGYHAVYEEYLRGFDDVPVLQDAVRIPARRVEPDFRRGERRDVRKESRPDAYAVREANVADLECLYAEYCGPAAVAVPPRRKKAPKRRSRKSKKR